MFLVILAPIPANNAPNTAPVNAKGGIANKVMRRIAVKNAIATPYTGPINIAAITLIVLDIGAIPSIRINGDKTTSNATIIAKNIIFLFLLIFLTFLTF